MNSTAGVPDEVLRAVRDSETAAAETRMNRVARRAQAARRRNQPVSEDGMKFAARTRTRKEMEAERLRDGYRWDGRTLVGGTQDRKDVIDGTFQKAFVETGLRSSRHPHLRLLLEKMPKKVRYGDRKNILMTCDSALLGRDAVYIMWNKRLVGIIRIDVDGVWHSWESFRADLEDCLPPEAMPHVACAIRQEDGSVRNPHLYWILPRTSGVWFQDEHDIEPLRDEMERARWELDPGLRENRITDAKEAIREIRAAAAMTSPQRLLAKVRRGLVKALLPIGADPGGTINPNHGKNPLSPHCDTVILNEAAPLTLAELRERVDSHRRLPSWRHRIQEISHDEHSY